MGRSVMDRGFRRIKKAAPQQDPRLALVEQFVGNRAGADPVPVPVEFLTTEDSVDLSSLDIETLTDVFVEDSQEPAEQPVADESENYPSEVSEAADEAPVQPEPILEPAAPVDSTHDEDYDPIAAVLG